jgi:hypothetical protein
LISETSIFSITGGLLHDALDMRPASQMSISMNPSRAVNPYRDRADHSSEWLILALMVCLPLRFAASQEVSGPPPVGKEKPEIAFDQIDRVLLHGEVPPPVDSFTEDAGVIASLPPLKANGQSVGGAVAKTAGTMLVSSALSFVPIAGPLIAGAGSRALNAVQRAEQQHETEKHNAAVAHFISAGTISHFAFYRGWIRSERQWELTIVKPDQGLTIVANLRNKTMQVIDERTTPETIVIDTAEGLPQPALIGATVTERLPNTTISGQRSRGYRTTATIDLKNAMSWCAPGRHRVVQVEYVTDLPDPQSEAPIEAARALADGCEPSTTASYREYGRLVLYRATTIDPDTSKGVTLMFERGNVHTLDENGASLFSIPEGFKKER